MSQMLLSMVTLFPRDSFDFNNQLAMDQEGTKPKGFTDAYPGWKDDEKGLYELFSEYVGKVMGMYRSVLPWRTN